MNLTISTVLFRSVGFAVIISISALSVYGQNSTAKISIGDAGKFLRDLLTEKEKSVTSEEFVSVRTTLASNGELLDSMKIKIWKSRRKNLVRIDTPIETIGSNVVWTMWIDGVRNKCFYQLGDVLAEAPQNESNERLEHAFVEESFESIRFAHYLGDDCEKEAAFLFQKGDSKDWRRIVLYPGTGVLIRDEVYSPEGVTVTEFKNVKINEVIPDDILSTRKFTNGVPVMGRTDFIKSYLKSKSLSGNKSH